MKLEELHSEGIISSNLIFPQQNYYIKAYNYNKIHNLSLLWSRFYLLVMLSITKSLELEEIISMLANFTGVELLPI